ncbi:MAG: hypothetical protein JNG90_06605 [Planctomycetaceae bacterium]|nr:hypothetical protein [Planctomycetaceae bacterium]
MAKSESQGLQIALILCVLMLILFIGTTYYFFSKYSEAAEMSRKDKEETTKMQASLRDLTDELHKLKVKAGFAETIPVAEWEKSVGEDMKLYAPTLTAEQQSYREALKQLAAALRESSTNLAATKADLLAQQEINEKREAAKDLQIAAHKQSLDEAVKTYAQEQSAFMNDRQRLEKEKADQLAINQKAAEDFDKEREEKTRQLTQLESQVGLVKAQLGQQQETIAELQGKTQAVPDGSIRRVNQRGTVWIDVGESDYLPRQLAFSVYGVDQNGVARDKRKGAIEVTQIIGPHLAEAKILEDDILNPIVPGDLIYTPLWQPGRQERFALAGFMDLDGDDLSDRHLVRDMITMSGGVIDAELDDQGKMQGAMSMETRYLIIGPKKEDMAEANVGKMEADAKDLGVEVISLSNFLERTGWKDTKTVLRYDGSRPQDFRGPARDGGAKVSRGVTSGVFQKRQPRKQLNSAYDARPVEEPAAPTPPPKPAAPPKAAAPSEVEDEPAAEGTDEMPAEESEEGFEDEPGN